MSEPITWAAVGMSVVSNMATWLYIIRGKKNNGNSRGPKPGQAEVCIKRGETIAIIETKQKSYEEDIREIKTDIKEIKSAVAER